MLYFMEIPVADCRPAGSRFRASAGRALIPGWLAEDTGIIATEHPQEQCLGQCYNLLFRRVI